MHPQNATIRALLVYAIVLVSDRADSDSDTEVAKKFAELLRTLQAGLHAIDSGSGLDVPLLTGLLRWTADWIPDTDDHVLTVLSELNEALSRSVG